MSVGHELPDTETTPALQKIGFADLLKGYQTATLSGLPLTLSPKPELVKKSVIVRGTILVSGLTEHNRLGKSSKYAYQ